jgi:peptidoglycan hydrolase CwlO-like protein
MIFYETFKHKFDVKKLESQRLLNRVEELSQVNGGLEDQINKQKQKNYKLQKKIEDLKERINDLKNMGTNNDLLEVENDILDNSNLFNQT